ncbi:MAG: hypothetical protein AVDCRST_MAG05-4941, partial [uncultured Rubrobacteraceae bacterium]
GTGEARSLRRPFGEDDGAGGVGRPRGGARDNRGPLHRSAGLGPRVPGGRQRPGRRRTGDATPRSEPPPPLLLPVGV